MKVILVKERNIIQILPYKESTSLDYLKLRETFNPELNYYEFEYNEKDDIPLKAYISAFNKIPWLLDDNKMIKKLFN